MRGPASSAESAVWRCPVGPAVSSETLTPSVDVPGILFAVSVLDRSWFVSAGFGCSCLPADCGILT